MSVQVSLTLTDATIAELRAIAASQLGTFGIRTNDDSPLVRSLVGNLLQLLACKTDEAEVQP